MRNFGLLSLGLICVVGCSKGPTIEGKWLMTAAQGSSTMEFTSNTFKQTSDGDMGGIKIHLEASGNYTYDGKKLVMTITEMKIPDQLKAFVNEEEVKKKPNTLEAQLVEDTLVIKPESTATGAAAQASTGTFKRVK